MNLSLNFYTQWYWKTNLHNLMHFLSLRADPHAQYEIRAYAEPMLDSLQRWVPLTHAAFLEYRMNAATVDLGDGAKRHPADAGRRERRPGVKRVVGARVARADGDLGR